MESPACEPAFSFAVLVCAAGWGRKQWDAMCSLLGWVLCRKRQHLPCKYKKTETKIFCVIGEYVVWFKWAVLLLHHHYVSTFFLVSFCLLHGWTMSWKNKNTLIVTAKSFKNVPKERIQLSNPVTLSSVSLAKWSRTKDVKKLQLVLRA